MELVFNCKPQRLSVTGQKGERLEYGCKRSEGQRSIGAGQVEKTVKRNRACISDVSAIVCTRGVFAQTEKSRYDENLVLKGGMFLYTLTNFEGRPTMDIDFMLRRLSNDLDSMSVVMKDICSVQTGNDFIAMEALGTERIAV